MMRMCQYGLGRSLLTRTANPDEIGKVRLVHIPINTHSAVLVSCYIIRNMGTKSTICKTHFFAL